MEDLKQYIEDNKERFLSELFELIRIPSISSIEDHKPDMYRAAEMWKQLLLDAGADIVINNILELPYIIEKLNKA